MNKANTQKLYLDFPRLYRDASKDMRETCMCWGFACGDGWFRLIYELSEAIEAEARKVGLNPMSAGYPRALQVKEKFGTLCFYVATQQEDDEDGDPYECESQGGMLSFRPVAGITAIRQIVREAENLSAHICEECGQAGTLRTDGWWHVKCDACEAKKK